MAINLNDIFFDFDDKKHIVHISAQNPIFSSDISEIRRIYEYMGSELLKRFDGKQKWYIILNLGKIAVELHQIEGHAEELYEFLQRYVYPGGYARYGMSIGRISAKLVSEYMDDNPPPLFNTKEEAFAYIDSLIEKEQRGVVEKARTIPKG